jgi:hypothetical protein
MINPIIFHPAACLPPVRTAQPAAGFVGDRRRIGRGTDSESAPPHCPHGRPFLLRHRGHQSPLTVAGTVSGEHVASIRWPFRSLPQECWRQFGAHQFAIAPTGMGWDTHRLWELLFLGTVPIVQSGPLDPLLAEGARADLV